MNNRQWDLQRGLDHEGYPLLLVYHLDRKEIVYIKRDGYYPDINRMVNLEN